MNLNDPDRVALLHTLKGQPCPFCGVTLNEPDQPHEAYPCPLWNQPYPIQQLAFAHLRLLKRMEAEEHKPSPTSDNTPILN